MGALIGLTALSGLTHLIGAKKQSNAAKDAAKIQQAAADKVAGINRGVYQQQMAGMEPYAAVGRSSVNTLGRLLQPGVPYTPQMQMADAQRQYNAPPPWSMTPGEGPQTAVPRATGPRAGAPSAPPGGGGYGDTVMLRAPNGSVRSVPADQAQQFIAKGAVRV